jgi:glycosyltransferase involved in cell wall biosynthesis
VNRYVQDDEVANFFEDADAVVLPYHRSSASGPLHVAMSHGKPVAVTDVGGLAEAAHDYAGAVLIRPNDPESIRAVLPRLAELASTSFADVHSWADTVKGFEALFDLLEENRPASEFAGGRRE